MRFSFTTIENMKLRGLSAFDILALMVFWGQIQNVLIQFSVEIAKPYVLAGSSATNETYVIETAVSNATAARLNFDGFRCKEKEGHLSAACISMPLKYFT